MANVGIYWFYPIFVPVRGNRYPVEFVKVRISWPKNHHHKKEIFDEFYRIPITSYRYKYWVALPTKAWANWKKSPNVVLSLLELKLRPHGSPLLHGALVHTFGGEKVLTPLGAIGSFKT